jgi:DNA-binding NarL/FixJ family response regulator
VTVRVLIVDDTELVRDGLRMALEADTGIEIAGEAGDGATGVAAAERLPPDELVAGVFAVARDDALVDPASTLPLIAHTRGHPPPTDLTAPERELLGLIGRGHTDAEIAERLGEPDVGARVAALLDKLGVRDRIHAVLAAGAST